MLLSACASRSAQAESDQAPRLSDAKTAAEAGLVDIAALVPDIVLDLRYAGEDNFVGQRIDGYHAARCFLLAPAARALSDVERSLRTQGLRLKLFDCYRPARAVRHFVEWAADRADQRMKARYYPNLDKGGLLGDYIAPVSGHSRAATVDLGLLRCDARGACAELDMGTGFDFFDPRAHTDSPSITAEQRANRHRLRAAMEQGGFANYPLEWWHYTWSPEAVPDVLYDVPVR
ncbi:MAG: peptidase M15 [Lysobacteraceae bacterium]|nr:MAG: peptidase M15 [Xanthomonadaceae bacterium]